MRYLSTIKLIGIVLMFLVILVCSDCCKFPRSEPNYPRRVNGWNDFYEGSTHFIAQLVLKKGESSDNGKIGVRVIDISRSHVECGFFPESPSPAAKLQFYRPANQEILCEMMVGTGNQVIDCKSQINIYVIGVSAINTKDGWIYFDLRE